MCISQIWFALVVVSWVNNNNFSHRNHSKVNGLSLFGLMEFSHGQNTDTETYRFDDKYFLAEFHIEKLFEIY